MKQLLHILIHVIYTQIVVLHFINSLPYGNELLFLGIGTR
jgi:hypothetical protein